MRRSRWAPASLVTPLVTPLVTLLAALLMAPLLMIALGAAPAHAAPLCLAQKDKSCLRQRHRRLAGQPRGRRRRGAARRGRRRGRDPDHRGRRQVRLHPHRGRHLLRPPRQRHPPRGDRADPTGQRGTGRPGRLAEGRRQAGPHDRAGPDGALGRLRRLGHLEVRPARREHVQRDQARTAARPCLARTQPHLRHDGALQLRPRRAGDARRCGGLLPDQHRARCSQPLARDRPHGGHLRGERPAPGRRDVEAVAPSRSGPDPVAGRDHRPVVGAPVRVPVHRGRLPGEGHPADLQEHLVRPGRHQQHLADRDGARRW